MRRIYDFIRFRLWIIGAILAFMQAPGFVSFIWEETLQSVGFAVKGAIDARQYDIAERCLWRFEHCVNAASRWQHALGWICIWMHPSYCAYFDIAARAQIDSYRASIEARREWANHQYAPPVVTAVTQTVASVTQTNNLVAFFDSIRAWAGPFPIYTNSSGRVKLGYVSPAGTNFWTLWRAHKEQIKEMGYSVTKRTNSWMIVNFQD